MKKEPNLGSRVHFMHHQLLFVLIVVIITNCFCCCYGASVDGDVTAMMDLKKSLNVPDDLGWDGTDPCNWKLVGCSSDNRIARIQIGRQGLKGTLPSNLGNLTGLQRFEVQYNQISGPLPSLSGLNLLQVLLLSNNNFTDIPADFFAGMSSLQSVTIDNNPLKAWVIPDSLRSASSLQNFSANSANIIGIIPDFLGGGDNGVVGLRILHLAFNSLEGGLPLTFAGSTIQVMWLNGQSGSRLNGTLDVLKNMTSLRQAWLHSNAFSGPLPDFVGLTDLEDLSLRDNKLTGPVPASLINLPSLKVLNLTNNMFQGPTPKFADSVDVDMIKGRNSFCLDDPGVVCDSYVDIFLSIAQYVGYPAKFADNWKGNYPCNSWFGIGCDPTKNITSIVWQRMGLTGTISPRLSELSSLQRLSLANNNFTGTIPIELTKLPHLRTLDVSNNQLYGDLPSFRNDVVVTWTGNVHIGSYPTPPESSPGSPSGPSSSNGKDNSNGNDKSNTRYIVGVLVASVVGLACIAAGVCIYKRKQKSLGIVKSVKKIVIHPHHSGDQDAVKITVASSSINGGSSETKYSLTSSDPSDVHNIETGKLVISIQVLRNVTNDFSEENILGRGGFGTVYKGELHDGTKIAVKRMECGSVGEKGLHEFKSEIAVLTKVRHRHLVALLGYCLDGNEKLLVYEYMPQGDLSTHLFNWKKKGLEPLEWMKRLSIALDVARAVEYLHGLARECFIHRDLKPSNILLSDEMRAKVADFGLVRLAPEGKASFATKLAGTFGYLAPEYAVTGRVTTKVDVFSFGVILMELITGRKALDETQPEESLHLVNWFRRMSIKKDTFAGAIDNTITLNEETLASINTISELAGHCTAREPSQRPDMGHVVNVISSLVELWKPTDPDSESLYGIDLEMSLPQAVKKWQAFEGHSNIDASSSSVASFMASKDNTETSIPLHPTAFADSFTSEDGR